LAAFDIAIENGFFQPVAIVKRPFAKGHFLAVYDNFAYPVAICKSASAYVVDRFGNINVFGI
jgi:hypothetical protein